MNAERILLRVNDAAELLSISRAEAYQLVAKGIIPSVRIGAMIRIPADRLKSMVAEQADKHPAKLEASGH